MYSIEGKPSVLNAVEQIYRRKDLTYDRVTPTFLLVHVDPYSVLNSIESLQRLLVNGSLRVKRLPDKEALKILDFKEKVKVERKGKKLIILKKGKNKPIQESIEFSKYRSREDYVGKRVKVVKGYLSGMQGIIQEVNLKNGTARVMFMVFGIPQVETLRLENLEIIS